MPTTPRVYLAGPDVFWPDAIQRGEHLKTLCRNAKLEGIYPLDSGVKLEGLRPFDQGCAIYQANVELIRTCSAILANMTPFRGPSMDVGTAFEMGYGASRKLLIAGYTANMVEYKTRTAPDGLLIEEFGMIDNLMVHGATGDAIFTTVEEAIFFLAEHLL